MAGSLREVRPGVWKLEYLIGRSATGRQVKRTKTFRASGKRAADRAAEQYRAEFNALHEAAVERRGTIAELADEWLDHAARLDRSPTTLRSYRAQAAAIVARFGTMRPRDLTARDVDRWYAELAAAEVSPATVAHRRAALRAMLRQARKWGYVDAVVTELATAPPVRTVKPRPPSASAVAALLAQASGENRRIFHVLAATGMRRGELCGLRWSKVGADRLAIVQSVIEVEGGWATKTPKTDGSARVVSLDAATVAVLAEQRAWQAEALAAAGRPMPDDGFVFANLRARAGGLELAVPRTPSGVSRAWRRLADEAGAHGVRLHDLRHWHATQLLGAGTSMTDVSARLGHSKVTTTLDIYSHATERGDGGAADAIGRIMAGDVLGLPPAP